MSADPLDLLPAVVFRVDRELRHVYVNRRFCDGLGKSAADVLGKTLPELGFPPDLAAELEGHVREGFAENRPVVFEFIFHSPAGPQRLVTHLVPEPGPDGHPGTMLGLTTDVTRLKLLASERHDLDDRFRAFLSYIPLPAWTQDEQGRYVFINPMYEKAVGIAAEDWLGRHVTEVWPPDVAEAFLANDREVLRTGSPVQTTETAPGPDGEPRSWLNVKFPIRDGRGRALVGGVAFDLTERLRFEEDRRAAERHLLQTQKLESLGVLAGGIAHDFNNLLTGILGNAELAKFYLPGGDGAVAECLSHIETAAQRAAELCREMLAYAGRGQFIVEPTDLNRLVGEMGQLLGTALSKKAVLKFNLGSAVPTVVCDRTQLRQVVMNLITNASDAIGDTSGVATLTTGVIDADEKYLAEFEYAAGLPPGRFAYLEVSDTGAGMDEATKARIFEPFFTTKFTGRGLGLSAVRGIVRGHGGAIKVYSQVGRGTTFKVLLPVAGDDEAPAADAPATPPGFGRDRVMLVIDDEEDVRVFTRKALERAGFRVRLAADGLEGLAAFKADPDGVAAVLLDLTMPRMGGPDTFRELRRVRPDVKVILTSGFSQEEATGGFAGKGLADFVRKPFRVQELLAAVLTAVGP